MKHYVFLNVYYLKEKHSLRIKTFIIALAMVAMPSLLPAPDLPPGSDSFSYLEKIRVEILKKDLKDYQIKYSHFKKVLSKHESRNNWKEYNRYGYIGKYQFGRSALNATGYSHITLEDFKKNPHIFPETDQEKAMDILLQLNESALNDQIKNYVGYTLCDTIRITRMGILAAAHLSGPANVKEFLESSGRENPRDRMGTHLSDYFYIFSRL